MYLLRVRLSKQELDLKDLPEKRQGDVDEQIDTAASDEEGADGWEEEGDEDEADSWRGGQLGLLGLGKGLDVPEQVLGILRYCLVFY